MERTILIVEDERPLVEAISIKLQKSGFKILIARTVEEAKKLLNSSGHVDAIWLDHYLMGKESGLDFVAWCKMEDSKFKEIPVFVVSNTASPDKVASYISLGIKDYYVKSNYRLEDIIEEIVKSI